MIRVIEELTKDNILNKITKEDIFNYYCPHNGNKFFKSEFRSEKLPSAIIYWNTNNPIYKDFGEAYSLDCFEYVMRKYNISFIHALDRINKDMKLGLAELSNSYENTNKFKEPEHKVLYKDNASKSKTIINVKYKEKNGKIYFDNEDIDYWTNTYFVRVKTLVRYKTFPIKWFEVIKDNRQYRVSPKTITYTQNYYVDDLGILRRKIYSPFELDFKWTSNITTLVVQGIKNLPKNGDLLIITKSMKDLLVLTELGYIAIATNNETSFMPIDVLDGLKKRFKKIIILFDNDETGIKFSEILCKEYELSSIFTPLKDASDTIKEYKPKITKEIIDEQIKNIS